MINQNAKLASFAAGAAVVALCFPSWARAQAADPVSDSASAGAHSGQAGEPGEIVVTATRRSESLQRVPIAVTAVDEEQLRALNVADTTELPRLVPALQFVQGSGTLLNFFSVRGVGTYVTSAAFDQSVGIAFDGVPLARPGGSISDLVDLDHIEVIEGPQGMLFGKNASAGLVNIITKAPQLQTTSFAGRLSYGSFNEFQTTATVNVPLGENAAIRASGWRFSHDGYVDSPNLGRDYGYKKSLGGRLRLRWKPGSNTDVNLTGEWTRLNTDPSTLTIYAFATNALGVQDYELANGTKPGIENDSNTAALDTFARVRTQAYTAQVDQTLGTATLTSVTSYRRVTDDELFQPSATSAPGYTASLGDNLAYDQFSQELRLASGAEQRLRYVLGLIYFRLGMDDLISSRTAGSVAVPLATGSTLDMNTNHYAVFGELTFDLTNSLRVIAGGRYSHDRVVASFNRAYLVTPPTLVAGLNTPGTSGGPYAVTGRITATEPSYRFGVQYDLGPHVMVYATASRGYKGPGLDFNFSLTQTAFGADGARVKPEIARNYEAGLRSKLFGNLLTLNVTAFHETFSDFQTGLRLPTLTPSYSVRNANEMTSDGVEVAATLRPTHHLALSGNAAYIHARYTDFSNAPCYPRQPTGAAGTPLTSGLCVSGVQSVNGQALANSPRFAGNLTAVYENMLPGGHPVRLQANVRHQSGVVFNSLGDPYERQPGYEVVNLSAGIRTPDSRFGLNLYGKNVFDKSFISRTVSQLSGGYYTGTRTYEAEATWGVSLDARF